MTKTTKAIIPVAGWGTRRLPITKAIEKSMLPIGNRPLVDYVVADCIAAGIRDIYFVVSEENSQLEKFYTTNENLNAYLRANGKDDKLPEVAAPEGVTFHFIVQDPNGKYGTSVPVALAAEYLADDESAVVLMGDDFLYSQSGDNDIKRLVDEATGGYAAIIGVEVPEGRDISRYGVFKVADDGHFAGIVEKPRPEEAPSRLMNVSKYVLTPVFLAAIKAHAQQELDGEYMITEPISQVIDSGEAMRIVVANGEYLDGGSVEGWLHANRVVLGDL